MIRSAFIPAVLALVLATGAPAWAQAPPPGSAQWADTLAMDFDVSPDITYRTANNTDLKLDVYAPRDRRSPVPTVMLIHGGGWVEGRKEYEILSVLPYLALGWAVVNVEYRLARNSPAPAAVEDCRCALAWITRHAKEYGFDTSKVVLTGGSAGGHLALITGMLPASSAFDRSCPTADDVRWNSGAEPAVKVAAIINWFGITDVADLLEGPNAKHYAIEWFGCMGQREELARQLSPIQYVRPGLPPVLTIHGDADDLVPYSHAVRLHEALGKAGVPNRLVTIRGGGHGDFSRQQMADNYAVIREFLREQHLFGGDEAASKEVFVDGFRLSYTVEGEGIPCLVVDDAPAMRRALPPGLRSRFRFVFMDPRMDVPSPAGYDLRRITLDTFLDDIERVRRDAGVDRVLVFGHSINGLTAYEYARKYPAHVIGVVMNGTPPFSLKRLGPIQEAYWAQAASPERKEAQRRSEEKTGGAIAQLPPGEAMRQGYIANAAMYWHDPAYDCAWLLEGVHWNREVWDQLFYHALDGYDIARRPPVRVPVLLTLGRDDYVVPFPVWDGIGKALPNLTVRIFEQSGHWAPVEEPALFERTLADWVDAAVLKKKSGPSEAPLPPK